MVGMRQAPGTHIGPRQSHRHAMDVNEALEAWQAQYSGQPPVGFMLRSTHAAVWTRIHYLHEGFEPRTVDDARRMAAHFDAICSALFSGATVLVTAIQFEPSVEESVALRATGARLIAPPSGWLESLEQRQAQWPFAGRLRPQVSRDALLVGLLQHGHRVTALFDRILEPLLDVGDLVLG